MTTLSTAAVIAAASKPKISEAGSGQLILAALVAIAVIVALINWGKVHAFLALILGSAALAAVAMADPAKAIESFTSGFGSTTGSVGLLVALGAMIGKLLQDSGGADRIVSTITGRLHGSKLPWGMALIAAIIGLPLFFEVGVVILVPVVVMVARRTGVSVMKVGIPALAGLSILHGLVPPHPGPQVAIGLLKADQAQTILFGLIVAIPTLIICGPLLGRLVDKWVPIDPAGLAVPGASAGTGGSEELDERGETKMPAGRRRPGFGTALLVILLPVVLMLLKGVADVGLEKGTAAYAVMDFIGTPVIALLLAVLVAYFLLGFRSGMNRDEVNSTVGGSLPGIAGILLIVAAGGGFKTLLVDVGLDKVIREWADGKNISVLLLGWLVAVGIRLATGSATVATTTAAGIVAGLTTGMPAAELSLLVLAIGCGSLFFSHVNDAGFWLVKEYFGMSVGQTIKSWSVMETAISVVGFAFIMLLSLVV